MRPRERVMAVINHEIPDRVPIVIGASNATGIKMGTYRQLKKLIGVEAEERYLYDWPELGAAAVDEAALVRLHSDVRGVLDREPQAIMEANRTRPPGTPHIGSWGIGQVQISPDNWFPGIHPLAEAKTLDDLENYPGWPDMNDPTRVAQVRAEAAQLAAANEYAIMATPWLLFPLERAFHMVTMENFMMSMIENPDFVRLLLHKVTESCKTLMGHFLRELGDNVDIIKIGDDLGTQNSLLMSPKMYREFLKPFHADYIAFIKARTNAKVFFHTDGDVFPLIGDFIEMGVDILNPIQTSAGKMADLPALKQRYGQNIVFCGAIDTHTVLPTGTPEAVRQEVRRVIEALGPGGGYMLATVHTIMNNVPAENVLAMVDAVLEFGYYA
jgi:uroporphyrinogen decarboxylase